MEAIAATADSVAIAWTFEHLRQVLEGPVRVLAGQPQREEVRCGVVGRHGPPSLDRNRGEPRHLEAALHHVIRCGEGSRRVADGTAPAQHHVVGGLLVEHDVAGERIGRPGGDGERVVVDVDEFGRVLCRGPRVGHDGRDGLPHEPHPVVGQQRRRDRHHLGVVDRVHRHRCVPTQIRGREHRQDAGRPRSSRRVDADDRRVCERAADQHHVRHRGQRHVTDEPTATADQPQILPPTLRMPDPAGIPGSRGRIRHATTTSRLT
jgi:hypothetical protein